MVLNANDNVTLASIVLEIADDVVRAEEENSGDYAPTRGRVFESTSSDAVLVGDGDAWIDITTDIGLEPSSVRPRDGGLAVLGAVDVSGLSGSIGELRRHDGGDGNPEGLYEWKGSSWEELAGSTSITPA